MLEVILNGNKIEKKFLNNEEIFEFAETELGGKENNVVIANDNENFITIISIYSNKDFSLLNELIFENPLLFNELKYLQLEGE